MGGSTSSSQPGSTVPTLPSRRTLQWARIHAWRWASACLLGDMLFDDLDAVRDSRGRVWGELADWPYVCLAALAIACPEVGLPRLCSCLGLNPFTVPGLLRQQPLAHGWRAFAIRKTVAALRALGPDLHGGGRP